MPPIVKKAELPETLRTYAFHGVDFNYRQGASEATADCPFCGRTNKFSVKVESGQWRCLVCGEGPEKDKSIRGGNHVVFLRTLHRLSKDVTKPEDLAKLAKSRGLMSPDTLEAWGVVKSIITGEWLVPGSNSEKALCQLYRYVKLGDKFKLLATPPSPTLQHQLHGLDVWGDSKQIVFLCEGPWDGMALWEVLRQTKSSESGLAPTGNPKLSFIHQANVIAVPGCTTFKPIWTKLFAGKRVIVLFDNDHPKKNEKTGQPIPPASIEGLRRTVEILQSSSHPPEVIQYLCWGDQNFDANLKSGTDLRDVFNDAGTTLGSRIKALTGLMGKFSNLPPEWVKEAAGASKRTASRVSTTIPCSSYKETINAWRKAMKWTEGLDYSFATMLASVVSVRLVGDQLWVKIIGPASCLDGDTPIYDPIANTTLTVRERTKIGKRFSVYSRSPEGELTISQALPPEEFPPTPMYEVKFKSGKVMRVTLGHEFWGGNGYVSLQQVVSYLQQPACDSYPLPTISDTDLSIQKQGAQRSKKTAEGFQSDCHLSSCSCGEQLPQELVDVQYDSASPTDVQVPTVCDSLHTDESLHNPLLLIDGHSSNLHVPYLALSSPGEFEAELHNLKDNAVHYNRSSLTVDNIQREKHQLHKDRLMLESAPQSNDIHRQSHFQKESYKHEIEQPLTSLQSHVVDDLPGKVGYISQSSLDSIPSFEGVLMERYSISSSVEEQPDHTENVDNTQQRCNQIDKVEQALVDALETNLNEQSSYISIECERKLGPILLSESDAIVKVDYIGEQNYYDFSVPINQNYWAEGFFHHNCGKTSLAKALEMAKDYVICEDVIRGFTSGWRGEGKGSSGPDDEDGGGGYDLASRVRNKTLITMDGDTLMQSPNLSGILGEARRLYDGTLKSHFKNGTGKAVDQHRFTWIICGTSSLRSMDSSELGERFLDCVLMDGIDDDFEDEVLTRVANRVIRNMATEVSNAVNSQEDPDMDYVMRLTGGYIEWLKANAASEMSKVQVTDEQSHYCTRLGKFVAFMRARPSTVQDETADREFAARLVTQHLRLASCLAVVMNKTTFDDDILKRVQKVALDTARGKTMEIARHLFEAEELGLEVKSIAMFTSSGEAEVRKMLRFLKKIGVTEFITRKIAKGMAAKPVWTLTAKMRKLWKQVHNLQ